MARLLLIILGVAVFVLLPFAIWGDQVETLLSVDRSVAWLRDTPAAVAMVIGLIAADIFLPVPSTAITSALGIVYGPVLGAAIAAFGAVLGAGIGYWLCRALGPGVAEKLAGAEGLRKAAALLDRWGFGIIALSRWVPVLPETLTFLSGLVRHPFGWFLAAVICGAIPKALVFATIGHLGRDMPVLIVALCAVAPVLLAVAARWVGTKRGVKNQTHN